VPGSHQLVPELIESDLVDQIDLMIRPVILGTGGKVFDEKPSDATCGSRNRRSCDGVVVLIYECAV
jgi:dihydrofolate reductase